MSHGPHGFFPPSTQFPTGRKPSSNSRDSLKSPMILYFLKLGLGPWDQHLLIWMGFGWDLDGFGSSLQHFQIIKTKVWRTFMDFDLNF